MQNTYQSFGGEVNDHLATRTSCTHEQLARVLVKNQSG